MPQANCPRCQTTVSYREGQPVRCPACAYPGPDSRAQQWAPPADAWAGAAMPAAKPGMSGGAVAGIVAGAIVLGIALIVVLAAVVFVLVTKLSTEPTSTRGNENASATISSNRAGLIDITLIAAGANGPYSIYDVDITVDGNICYVSTSSTAEAKLEDSGTVSRAWEPGEKIVIGASASAADCGHASSLASGSTHTVSLTVHGTLIMDETPVVVQ